LDPPRSIPVEKNADGNLDTCKDEEVDRRQQPGLRGIKSKFGCQGWRDGGDNCSEEEGKIVTSGKWKEDGQDQSPPFLARVIADISIFISIRFRIWLCL
jgi:hypothetical protein